MSVGRVLGRWLLRIAAAAVAVVVLCAGAVYGASEWRMRSRVHVPTHRFAAATPDARTLALGRHEAIIRGCTDCHADDLGGRVFLDNAAIGRLVASNLPRGAQGPALTDEEWELAIRHGIRGDGRKLKVMPDE